MALTKQQFIDGCSHLTSTGALSGIGALFIDGNNQTVLDEGDNNANITPDEATINQALLDLASTQASEQTQSNASTTIKDLRSIATDNAPFIASLMTWCLNADLNSDDTATRFTNLVATFTGQSSGVINVFKAGVLAEYDIDIDTIGIGNLSDAQKRDIIRFARSFASAWAIVLI